MAPAVGGGAPRATRGLAAIPRVVVGSAIGGLPLVLDACRVARACVQAALAAAAVPRKWAAACLCEAAGWSSPDEGAQASWQWFSEARVVLGALASGLATIALSMAGAFVLFWMAYACIPPSSYAFPAHFEHVRVPSEPSGAPPGIQRWASVAQPLLSGHVAACANVSTAGLPLRHFKGADVSLHLSVPVRPEYASEVSPSFSALELFDHRGASVAAASAHFWPPHRHWAVRLWAAVLWGPAVVLGGGGVDTDQASIMLIRNAQFAPEELASIARGCLCFTPVLPIFDAELRFGLQHPGVLGVAQRSPLLCCLGLVLCAAAVASQATAGVLLALLFGLSGGGRDGGQDGEGALAAPPGTPQGGAQAAAEGCAAGCAKPPGVRGPAAAHGAGPDGREWDALSETATEHSVYSEGGTRIGRRTKGAALGAAAGGAALGAGGGAAGLVAGGAAGLSGGLLLAPLTFGLSIPVGAVLGSTAGATSGALVGGAVGLLGGGAAGYRLSPAEEEEEEPEGQQLAEASQAEGEAAAEGGEAPAAPEAAAQRGAAAPAPEAPRAEEPPLLWGLASSVLRPRVRRAGGPEAPE